jgi:hypothetical protein
MALEQEVQALSNDINDISGTDGLLPQMTALAPGLAQGLVLAGQFAGILTSASQQLAALAAGVHDAASAADAQTAEVQIQRQCQMALTTLGPAEQSWNSAAGLAQQRSAWLLARWQQCHSEPPSGTPIAMTEPLAQALAAYSAAVTQLDATMHQAAQFPPLATPTGGVSTPAAVAAWLQQCNQDAAASAATITSDAGHLSTTLTWTNVQATATTAVTTAQGWLALAQRVAAAVATPPTDPASLAARLGDLASLRVSICPDPITPADRAIYHRRMAELDQALAGLLAAPTGAASTPVAMLPVRLETRTFPAAAGGTEFRIRVYVDSIHVNAHDPRLTADEAQWSAHVKTLMAGGVPLPAAEWAQLAARFGPARAAYLLHPDPAAGSRPGPWNQAATTAALPDRWLAVAYGPDGAVIGSALGAPITPLPLQVSLDPTVTPAAAAADDVQVDPGARWMIDFGTAVTQGMGISLIVDGGAAGSRAAGAASGPATLSRLVVIGVRAADATTILTDLLTAHHYTSGLELIGYGTPTNNTSDAPSGFSRSDPGYARSYALEVLAPATVTGDAARLAAALGIAPGVFAAAAAGPLTEQTDQQAMTALTWPATWGSFLTGFTGMSQARAERLRSWAVAWLRPGGPLPTLGIGQRIYGVVPVLALDQWADPGDAAAADVHGVVTGLLGTWLAAEPSAAGLDFDTLLARRPVSGEAWGRAAAIMPGWLQAGYDLMGVTNSQVATITNTTLPSALAQIGADCGLPGPLTWPAGLLVLPDPLAPAPAWPLVVPDGTLPFCAGAAAADQPGSYLQGLLAAGPRSSPASLLEFVAGQSCTATPGVIGAPNTLSARGNVGDEPEPVPPGPTFELNAALHYLAGRTGADFDSLFGSALDAATSRLDAWVTALATRRLGELRTTSKTGILIGGFSWVENLVARPPLAPAQVPAEPGALTDPYNGGYQVAPSLQQATTAAVLYDGYRTRNPLVPGGKAPPPGAAFAIDLSSRRARLAAWLLDGIRQGQPLSVLLGYRFERWLQEAGLGDLIEAFRQAAPYDPVITGAAGAASTPTESAVPTDVVDGVALVRVAPSQPGPPTAADWAQAQPALTELADALDAAADAVTAQALHASLTGNSYAAAATLDSVASGAVPPPELSFLNTVRTGIAVNHRVLVPVPSGQPYPPAGWPATPRGSAEPALTSWVAGLIGDPAQVTAAVSLVDAAGAAVPGGPATITLSSLGLGPLDLVALADQPAELDRLAVHAALSARPSTAPLASDGTLDPNPARAARPLSAVLSIAQSVAALIGAGRGADARDLAPAGTVTDPGANLAELAARVHGAAGGPAGVVAELASAAAALSNALPGDPAPGSAQAAPAGIPAGANPGTLAAALIQAVLLGVGAAAPAGTGAAALAILVGQARGAWAEIIQRQAAVSALEPAAGADEPTQLAARLGQLEAALGGGFRALPLVTTNPANLIAEADALTATGTADPGQGPEAWLVKAGRVHQGVADLLDACCAAEALGTGPSLALSIAQLPLPVPAAGGTAQPAPWAGLPFTGQPPPANCLSLAMVTAAPPGGALSALVVADWVEVIPSAREIAGLTYHYDAPDAQAPQTVLLAVPGGLSSTAWSYGDLVAAVASARNLAHARGADYLDLPGAAREVLPAAYFADATELKPGPWRPVLPQLAVPSGYMVQTLGAVTISTVSVAGGALEQSKAGQITVTGMNFAPAGGNALPPSAFTVTGGGVTVTGGTVANTQAVLSVTVDPNAAPGVRGLSVGTATLANCVAIHQQPRATGCNTTRLAQAMSEVTQTVTVTGQVLGGASIASATGGPTVTWQLASASSTQVLITVKIAASRYSPYSPPPTSGSVAAALPRLPNGGPGNGGTVPHPRPPVHVTVPLTLTISPAPGEPTAAFTIVLDEIV